MRVSCARALARVEVAVGVGVRVTCCFSFRDSARVHVRAQPRSFGGSRHKSTSRTGGTLGTCTLLVCGLLQRHALPNVLIREQTTRLNTSWNDSGRSQTPGHVGRLSITLHRDQICQQPTQRTSAWRYGTGTILTIRILGLASTDRRKQVATRISRVYHIPQRDRQRCSSTGTG